MISFLLGAAVAVHAAGDALLCGTVRSADDGRAIAGARVQLDGGARLVLSDDEGRYVVAGMDAGTHELLVGRTGFRPRALRVTLGAGDSLVVDVVLEPTPIWLDTVVVRARGDAASTRRGTGGAIGGVWVVDGDRLREPPSLAGPDVLAALEGLPGMALDVDRPTALHVYGGGADQNRVLLDGAPVFAPYHFGGLGGALNPDALDRLELHAGVPSATLGGALSSVVATTSRAPDSARVSVRGGVTVTDAGLVVDGPLPGRRGGFLVSGRSGYPAAFAERDESHVLGENDDLLVKLATTAGRGRVELLAFRGGDALRFPSSPLDSSGAQPLGGARHRIGWRSATYALRWQRPLGARGRLESQLWRAELRASADWRAADGDVRMASARTSDGARVELTRDGATRTLVAGAVVEREAVRYAADGAGAAVRAVAEPLTAAAYAEYRHDGARWQARAGVRGGLEGAGEAAPRPRASPRAVVGYRVGPRLTVSGGAGRTYQAVQSLGSPESVAGALLPAELAVANGARVRVPVARADQAVLDVEARPTTATRVVLSAYARRMDGLALAPPARAEPFAASGFVVGRGRARGLGLWAERRGERLRLEGAYDLSVSRRTAGGLDYQAPAQPRHAFLLALAARARATTTVRATLRGTAGARTGVVGGPFDWEACDPLNRGCEASGAPRRVVGAPDGVRLPASLRLDLGVRHAWRVRVGGRDGELGARAAMANVLGRRNVWAVVADPRVRGGPTTLVSRQPSLLSVGVDWRY